MEEEFDRFRKGLNDDDENLHDDITENVSIIERRNRRRSSIFAEVRKSLSETRKADKCNSPDSENQPSEEDLVRRYIEDLRREKKEWLDVTKKRKQDYEATFKEYTTHCQKRRTMTEKECLQFLDDADKKYLGELPNFSKIAGKYRRFVRMYKTLEMVKRRNTTMGEVMLDMVCKDLEAAKQSITQYSMNQPL